MATSTTESRIRQRTIHQLFLQYTQELEELKNARPERSEAESVDELRALGTALKTVSKTFNLIAKQLIDRSVKAGSVAQATDVRNERKKNNDITKEYLRAINADLEIEDAEAISGITSTTKLSDMSSSAREERRLTLFTELQKTRASRRYEDQHELLENERLQMERDNRRSREQLDNQRDEQEAQIRAQQRRLEREKREELIEVELAALSQTEEQLSAVGDEEGLASRMVRWDPSGVLGEALVPGPKPSIHANREPGLMSNSSPTDPTRITGTPLGKEPINIGQSRPANHQDLGILTNFPTSGNVPQTSGSDLNGVESLRTPPHSRLPPQSYSSETSPRRTTDIGLGVPLSSIPGHVPPLSSNAGLSAHVHTHHYLARRELFVPGPDPFAGSGQEERFFTWSALLQNRMSGVELSAMDQISVLKANTIGEANKLVENFLAAASSDPTSALKIIWEKLKQRYGSSEHVANNLRKRLCEFPVIRSDDDFSKRLRELEDLCLVVNAHMGVVPSLQSLNFGDGLWLVKGKLPEFLQNRWRKVGTQYKAMNEGQHPPFTIFLKFLTEMADEFSDPSFFPSIAKTNDSFKHRSFALISHRSQSLPASQDEPTSITPVEDRSPCIIHQPAKHRTVRCHSFAQMNVEDRRRLAKDEALCYRCLGFHKAEHCTSAEKCYYCQSSSHHSILHKDEKPQSGRDEFRNQRQAHPGKWEPDPPTKDQRGILDSREKTSLCSQSCGSRNGVKSCSKTLLVELTHRNHDGRLRCYAIIDEQSNTMFADPQVFKFFDMDHLTHNYTISTLSGHRFHREGRVLEGLVIQGVGEPIAFELPKAFENAMIPDTRDEVATPESLFGHETVSKYASNFNALDTSVGVLLLIGRDSSEVMKTKTYGEHSPFVHHTSLGWAVVGPICAEEHL